jgi:hypothetical protein
MTRMHDGSLPPLRQSETTVQGAGASDRTTEAARVLPGGGEQPPVRDVLVSYKAFKERRRLRLRVMAAFEKLEASTHA